MRIQIVSTYYAPETTGNAPYATSLAEGLARNGHEVLVLAGAPHYPNWAIWPSDSWRERENRNGVRVQRKRSYVPARPNFVTRIAYELGFGLRFASAVQTDADAVLLLSPSLFGSAVVRARLALARSGVPVVLWVQDLYSAGVKETPGSMSRLLGRVLAAVEGALARSCARTVVIHERFRAVIENELDVPAARVSVVRNWTHVSPPGETDVPAVRARLGWKDSEAVVLHAGNMGAKQGLENVVSAARRAEQEGAPIRFVLMGDGNQRQELEQLGRGCAHLTFVYPLPDREFLDALAAADVLLVNERPTLKEAAVPSKLTTYFAMGQPVLAATDAKSATADEIRASRAGRLVAPDDPEALVHAALEIRAAWSDADALAGPAFVRDNLSTEAAVSAFDELLHAAVRGDAGSEERKA